jgi:hypothetical protein
VIGGIYFASAPFAGMWWLDLFAPNTFVPRFAAVVNKTVATVMHPE